MKNIFLTILICLIIALFIVSSGCIEVTPSSGGSNASAFGLNNTGGNLSSVSGGQAPSTPDSGQNGTALSQDQSNKSSGGPDVKVPVPLVQRVVPVTPRAYEGLPTPVPTVQSRNKPQTAANITPISIFSINQSFKNNATAFEYALTNPPLIIDLDFYPEMGTRLMSWEKRTGTKEGDVNVTVTRPLKDAWFEMRVYDKKNGMLVTREGYGVTYSEDGNKTVVIRTAGTYQFDFMGNNINTKANFTIPVPDNELYQYQDILNQLNTRKEEANRIPAVFLVLGDLPAGWEVAGDVTRTETLYQSTFKKDAVTLRQKIKKFASNDLAFKEVDSLKAAAGSDSTGASLIGQRGYIVDMSQVKTQLVFVENSYLVELSSFTPPNPVPVADLQNYGNIIIKRIQSAETKG